MHPIPLDIFKKYYQGEKGERKRKEFHKYRRKITGVDKGDGE